MSKKPNSRNTKLTAKDLIAAHRKASARHDAAMEVLKAVQRPDRVHVTVAEIGPRCVVYDLKHLDRVAREYIDNNGLDGFDRINFQKQMVGYREALILLEKLYQGWRESRKIDEIDDEQGAAYDELCGAWKALIAGIKSHPADIPEIARYVASLEASANDMWRGREVLRAIASAR